MDKNSVGKSVESDFEKSIVMERGIVLNNSQYISLTWKLRIITAKINIGIARIYNLSDKTPTSIKIE
jgi:hypothetical protein